MGDTKRRTQVAKTSQHSFGRVPCVIFHYQLCSRYIFCFFFRVNKKEVCFFGSFLVTRQEMNKKKDLFQFIFYVNRDYQFLQEDNQQKHQNNQLFFLMM